MVVVAAPLEGGGGQSALDRARETYPASGTLKHAGLSGFQLTAGTSGCTIAEIEGPDNAGDFAGLALTAGQELVFGQSITMLRLSAGEGIVYNSAERPAQWFVSSHSGDDNNDGFTASSQFATIAKLNEYFIAAGDQITLDDDSFWRAMLVLPVSASVVRSNTGTNRPQLDASDIATNASFSLSSGQTNTYEIPWVADPSTATITYDGAFDKVSVFENGTLLKYRNTISEVEVLPGSYTNSGAASDQNNITYVHPLGSTNPISDGKTYEITKRAHALVLGDGATADGLYCSKAVEENGPILAFENATIRNCVGEYGTRHIIYAHSGLVENCTLRYPDVEFIRETSAGHTMVVFYKANAAGLEGIVRNTSFDGNLPGETTFPDANISAAYAHATSFTENIHALITFDNCIVRKCRSAFDGFVERLIIRNCDIQTVLVHTVKSKISELLGTTIIYPSTAAGASFQIGSEHNNVDFTMRGSVLYTQVSAGARGINVDVAGFSNTADIQYSVIGKNDPDGGQALYLKTATATLDLTLNNCILHNYRESIRYDTGLLTGYAGNNNLYFRGSGTERWNVDSSTVEFTAWKALHPGDDVNSVIGVDAGFTDPTNGDFTTTAPEVDTLQAGVEYYVAS